MPELPPDGPEDLPRVVPFRRESNGAEPREVPRPWVSVNAAILPPAKPRLFHVDELIPAQNVTLLSGDGAVGKSLLMMQLSTATVLGRPWMNMPTARGRALFISAEDDLDEMNRRLEAIVSHEGVDKQDLDALTLVSLVEHDAILARANRAGALELTPAYAQLDIMLRDLQPALVTLDTLADMFSGNENDRGLARQFIGMLRKLAVRHDTTIVLLAHPSLSGLNSGSGLSGSTAWNNSVRSRLYFERVKSDEDGSEPDPDARVLRTMKANYASKDRELRLTWRAGVFVPEATSSLGAYVARDRAQTVFLEILADYITQGRAVSAEPSATYAPSLFARDPRAADITKAGLRQAMDALFKAGRIRVHCVGPPSRQRQRLVLT